LATELPIRQPRLSHLVAAELRRRIVSGQYAEGDTLPRLPDLAKQFGVSSPSIREALRVLETEGLVTVQRGRDGGVLVLRPQRDRISYTLSLVLQSEGVVIEDVLAALRWLFPVCVAACASRPDRRRTVVPRLRANLESSAAVIHDAAAFRAASRQFHREVVEGCGNDTLGVVVSAVEGVVAAQAPALSSVDYLASFEDLANRQRAQAEHVELTELIAAGKRPEAERLAVRHFSEQNWRVPPPPQHRVIDAAPLG
jgi:GntR family transcriptional repressor for pyruvate dehydrogenase complex